MIQAGPRVLCWAFLSVSSQVNKQASHRLLPCLLAKAGGLVPGSWVRGKGRGVPPCLHTGVSPGKNAVCEICYPTCPVISSGINQPDSAQVSAVRSCWGRGERERGRQLGSGMWLPRGLLTPLEPWGPWHTKGVQEMFGGM